MTNLVPTRVLDKNGRLTTVYKKDGREGSSNPFLPAPVASLASSREVLIDQIIDEMHTLAFIENDDKHESVKRTLDSYSDQLLGFLTDAFHSDETASIAALLIESEEPEHLVRESVTFMPKMKMNGFYDAFRLVSSLHHGYYQGLPVEEDYSLADERTQEQCLAILKISVAIHKWARDNRNVLKVATVGTVNIDRVQVMSDQRTVSLALEMPHAADLICNTIRERGTGDFGAIYAVVHSESLPLSSGTL